MKAIYKRELSSYFNTMIGYVFVGIVVCLIGIYFMVMNLYSGYPYFSYVLYNIMFIFIVMVPLLTMKSMAEDRRNKTDQLLMSSPVTTTQVVLGKYFAMLTVYAIPLLIACFCPLIIWMNGTAYLLVDYSSIFAYFCMGALYIAIGMFVSSLTESQIISAVITFGALLILYLWDSLIEYMPTTALASLIAIFIVIILFTIILWLLSRNQLLTISFAAILIIASVVVYIIDSSMFEDLVPTALSSVSCAGIFYNFAVYSVFDVAGLFFFISVAALFVFLTIQTTQKRRWS